MTFDLVDVLVIVTCVAILCQKIYYFAVVAPKLRVIIRELKKFVAAGEKLVSEGKKEMDSLSVLASRVIGHRMDESPARALLKEDVELMKQWTHDAFVETLNKRPPPEIPEKIIQRYGKAGDADWVFSRIKS